jgi:hypothetical protein
VTITDRMAARRRQQRALRRVCRAACRLEQAERERAWALAWARAEGVPICTLAAAAGLSLAGKADADLDELDAALGELQAAGKLSTLSRANPGNVKLAAQVQTVFQGETLRSMLLNAYGWWKVSQITYIAALIAFGLGGLALIGSAFTFASGRRTKEAAEVLPHAATQDEAPAKAA